MKVQIIAQLDYLLPLTERTDSLVHLERTLSIARKAWGDTHPNPMVGALILENGEVVAEGFHERAGQAHAEVSAFSSLGRKPRPGASLFISLEPCSTSGQTPPCTDAIIKSGIKQVFVGCLDPNPNHSGRGLKILRDAGVSVELAPKSFQLQATRLNFIFNHLIVTGKPLFALKMAESANGMVSDQKGFPSRVTEDEARKDVMKWRRLFPAICVGAGTVLIDDPSLTSRMEGKNWCPQRIIVDPSLSTLSPDISLRILYKDEFRDRTLILYNQEKQGKDEKLLCAKELGLNLVPVAPDKQGMISPTSIANVISELGLSAVYCEGGPTLASSLMQTGQIDYLFHYQSPKVFNGMDAVAGINLKKYNILQPIEELFGPDHLTHGFL